MARVSPQTTFQMTSFKFVPQHISLNDAGDSGDAAPASGQSIVIPSQRQRVQLACNTCRRSKSRCDGRRPACSRCSGRASGSKCVYEKEAMKTQRYIALLEDKLLELESTGSTPFPHSREQTRIDPQAEVDRDSSEEASRGDAISRTSRHTAMSPSDASLNRTDALVMVPSAEGNICDNGGSSITSFLHSVSHSIGIGEVMNRGRPLSGQIENGSESKDIIRSRTSRAFQLPPRRLADTMMSKFWTYIHTIYPVLNRPMIESSYCSLWQLESDFPSQVSNEDPDTNMAIFNVVFALVCQMENEEESADHFYQKSRHSYAIDAIDEPSLKTVQLLVLTGIYLQSTKFASRCWFVVGSAIRYAHYLGLDVKDEELSSRAEHGYVTRRRVWHSCIMLDRLLSLSFNRKSMTCEDIGIDLPQITQCDDSGNAESSHIPPFIKYSVTLFEIMNKTLVHIYHQASHENRLKDNLPHWWNRPQLANILSQTQALDDLCSGMPDHLNPDSTETRTAGLFAEEIGWQSYVFRSRFLYVRILILRPLLLSAAIANVRHMHRDLNSNNSSRFTIEEGTARGCCSLCIDTVHQLIVHMSHRLATTFKMAKWREFHYAFVCAISISIARLCSFDSDSFREYQLNKSWDLCVDILHHYKPRIESAQRAMDILDCLNSQVAKVMKDGLYGTNPQPSQPEVPNEEHSSSLFGLTGFMDENSSMGSFDPYGLDYAWLNSEVGGLGWLGG